MEMSSAPLLRTLMGCISVILPPTQDTVQASLPPSTADMLVTLPASSLGSLLLPLCIPPPELISGSPDVPRMQRGADSEKLTVPQLLLPSPNIF